LIAGVREARPRAIGRAISLIENGSADLPRLARALAPDTGRAHIVGLTGSPGVGKSTITSALVAALRADGQRVGCWRSIPARRSPAGHCWGIGYGCRVTPWTIGSTSAPWPPADTSVDWRRPHPRRCACSMRPGFDTVLLETVGVGQSEIEVAATADTTLVLLAPGMGDGVQAAKAGILEIGDIFVVNKSDRDGSQALIRELRGMIALGERDPAAWKPPIVATVALDNHGIDELWQCVQQFRDSQIANGQADVRRITRAGREVESLALGRLRAQLSLEGRAGLGELATAVSRGELDPYTAADQLWRGDAPR
jgi:LAO/AO transport system kinase